MIGTVFQVVFSVMVFMVCFMPCPHLFKTSKLGFFPNVIVSGKV